MNGWKVSVLPFSVVVPWERLRILKQWTDVGFVEAGEGSGRRAIGRREDRVYFKEAMTGKSGDSTKLIFEGERRVKGNAKELNRWRRRDGLTVISDVLWFELFALLPFKEHPNRFGAPNDDRRWIMFFLCIFVQGR